MAVHAAALDGSLDGLLGSVGPLVFYLVVWALVFTGTALFVGLFVPFITGDSLLFASGILSAGSDRLDIWVLAVGTGIAAVLGDQVAFVLGRRWGRPYLTRHGGPRTRRMIERTERFYRAFGWWAVVIARFIPWARVFVPVIAGVAGMRYLRFTTANVAGSLAWAVGITVIGYFAASIPGVKAASYAIAGACIAASIIAGIRAWRADRAGSAALG